MAGRWITESKGDLAACLGRMAQGVALRETLMGNPPQNQIPYEKPLLDAIGLFNELGIGYALIGGVAAMYYGRPRFTEDVDFVAAGGHREALDANPDAMRCHHFDPTCTWKLYHESGVEIDIWKDEHSDAIVRQAREVQLVDRPVRIADPNDLIAMKLRAGRLRDDYDIAEILNGTSVDDAIVASLVTEPQFARYLEIKQRKP